MAKSQLAFAAHRVLEGKLPSFGCNRNRCGTSGYRFVLIDIRRNQPIEAKWRACCKQILFSPLPTKHGHNPQHQNYLPRAGFQRQSPSHLLGKGLFSRNNNLNPQEKAMSPEAGNLLLNEVAPRLRSAIPNNVHFVDAEDAHEVIQDSIAMAAKMLHNAERNRKKVTPGNIAYYTILHQKAARRSVGQPSCPCIHLRQAQRPRALLVLFASSPPGRIRFEPGQTRPVVHFLMPPPLSAGLC